VSFIPIEDLPLFHAHTTIIISYWHSIQATFLLRWRPCLRSFRFNLSHTLLPATSPHLLLFLLQQILSLHHRIKTRSTISRSQSNCNNTNSRCHSLTPTLSSDSLAIHYHYPKIFLNPTFSLDKHHHHHYCFSPVAESKPQSFRFQASHYHYFSLSICLFQASLLSSLSPWLIQS